MNTCRSTNYFIAWQRRATASTLQNISERRLPLGTPSDRLPLPPPRRERTSAHIKTVKAEDMEHDQSWTSPSEPPLYADTWPPFKSLSSRGKREFSSSDSVTEDQLRVADLATAKLERQSKRILENDLALSASKASKPKATQKPGSKQWLSLESTDSSDGDNTTATKPFQKSPLDAHAKVFRPSSRESSRSHDFEPLRKDSAYLSMDEGEFQLVTNRKTRSSARPAVGLSAYQVKVDDKPFSIATPINEREIYEVFGNPLPPLAYFSSAEGTRNGQVSFAIHPNGDISAQQWSSDKYQWHNIGQFSNVRKRTEGNLASHRLKGETEMHSLQQQTLAYFRAVAKQREAMDMGLPFGTRELQAVMPKVPVERAVRKLLDAPPALTSPARSTTQQSSSVKESQTHSAWGLRYQRLQDLSSPTNSSLQQEVSSPTPDEGFSTRAYNISPRGLTSLNNLTFGTQPTVRDRTPASESFRLPKFQRPPLARHVLSEPPQYTGTMSARNTAQPSSDLCSPISPATYTSSLEKAQSHADAAADVASLTQHHFTKACLNKMLDAASSRKPDNTTATRTVLHDPFQGHSPKALPDLRHQQFQVTTAQQPQMKSLGRGRSWSETQLDHSHPFLTRRPAALSDQKDSSRDLRVSEPDFSYKSKPVKIIDIKLPPMTDEELAYYSRPTPQNFNGPFFMGSPDVPNEAIQKTHDEELNDWFWKSQSTIQRQDEHFQYIKAAHYQSIDSGVPKTSPEPIGTPSTSAPRKSREQEPFNETSTRLLLAVHDSLSQYTHGPLEQRRDYLAPFCDPPEWCIDKGPNGNNSFFGQDWGQPPERISRDSRYRPLPYEGKFGNFDNFDIHRGSNVRDAQLFGARNRFF